MFKFLKKWFFKKGVSMKGFSSSTCLESSIDYIKTDITVLNNIADALEQQDKELQEAIDALMDKQNTIVSSFRDVCIIVNKQKDALAVLEDLRDEIKG